MTDLAHLIPSAKMLIDLCRSHGLKIATAESCTGGLIAATLTEIPGSSEVIDRGFVTYSNQAKIDLLDVPEPILNDPAIGAVSQETAHAMAQGALQYSEAHLVVAVTGIAGPGGGSLHKPVGLVHFAAVRRGRDIIHREQRFGDIGRSEVRLATVREALGMLDALARG
ncbi:MAG: CinA family protein [Bauldia sp.]